MALFSSKRKVKMLIVGLDNSGKTTIINWMKPKKRGTSVTEVTPTISFETETFSKQNFDFTVFDMSGQQNYRALWEKFYSEVDGIIFVVDSADKIRYAVAKNELETLLDHKDIKAKPVPILFLANKMDIPSSIPPKDLVAIMGLESITDRSWVIVPTNALTGEGIQDGLKWMVEKLDSIFKAKK